MATIRYRAAGGVVIQQGKIPGLDAGRAFLLLLDRPDRNEIRLPKGHIDPGEDAQRAAVRETEEEAGFADLLVLGDLGNRTVEFDYENDHYIRDEHYFLMALASERVVARPEHDAAQFQPLWVALDEAPDLLTYPSEQEVVRVAIEFYRQTRG